MTLEYYEYEECGVVQSRFVECPLCGHEFEFREPRWQHFYDEHTPEDIGLDPLGTVSGDVQSPLWDEPVAVVEEDGGQSSVAASGSGSGR